MIKFPLSCFSQDESFPCHIQHGLHTEDMYPHSHADFSELTFVLGGSAVHQVKNEESILRRGDIFVIHPQTVHAFSRPHDLRLCTIMARLDELIARNADIRESVGFRTLFLPEKQNGQPGLKSVLRVEGDDWANVLHALDMMLREYQGRRIGYQTCVRGQLESLVVLLSRLYDQQLGRQNQSGEELILALAWLEEHYTEEISLEKLAGMAGMSTRHFDRLFMEKFHLTPKAYIAQLRITKARAMLRHTEKPITEIAFDCGYVDSNYFARVFRKICGMSPQQYRQDGQKA